MSMMPGLDDVTFAMLFLVLMAIAMIMLLVGFSRRYIKVPSNKVLVIFGRKSSMPERRDTDGKVIMPARIIGYKLWKGGATFIWPILERVSWLSLESHTVDLILPEVATRQGAKITVEASAEIKVSGDAVSLHAAVEQLLDKTDEQIIGMGRRILEAHARSVCAKMTVESINADRMALSKKIGEEAVPEFERLGLQITVFVIKDIKQKAGNHDLQGNDRIPEIQMDVEKDSTQALKNVLTVEKSGVEM